MNIIQLSVGSKLREVKERQRIKLAIYVDSPLEKVL